ncbi:MAG: SO_0444 family Cu/Zn efflux transporter [Magnetococcales bacterium]|nr:SO_0444 family Cu/Zn efflux transporter [Magnetococcales bacterium]
MTAFFANTLDFFLDAAPWLVLGLVTAGLIKAWVPDDLIMRWMGGRGYGAVVRAAFVGAPLPLCSCGVLPVALGLRRNGASKGATVSFLIATPETGVDSIAVSHALLGPFMAIARPIAAVSSAILAGLLVGKTEEPQAASALEKGSACESGSCCPSKAEPAVEKVPFLKKGLDGLHYAFTNILDDMSLWLLVGLIAAGGVATLFPPHYLAQWGGGLAAMLVMLLVVTLMYICATASTPVAAAFLHVGVSPGAVMVFLLAGPATNAATLMVVKKELGKRATLAYLAGISIGSLGAGLLVDYLLVTLGWTLINTSQYSEEILPAWLAWGSLLLLVAFSIPSLRNQIFQLGRPGKVSACRA